MTSSPNDPTDEEVALPWQHPALSTRPPVLHLVVAWFRGEPGRVGHVARLDARCILGRGEREEGNPPFLEFREARPDAAVQAPPITTTSVSRRQLEFEPTEDAGAVKVRSIGRRALFQSGLSVKESVVRAGATLMLENTAVFLVELRPPVLPRAAHYSAAAFPFGAPDAHGYVGESPAAWQIREELAMVARLNSPILIHGPSGSGKELAAGMLHGLSTRRRGPFISRNAATFPAGLVDAELFGCARDYPNAGSPQRDGLVAAADGGVLFLDEIGDLPEEQQARLLRVVDRQGEYQRLGDATVRRSNFRLVAATHRDPVTLKHDFLARFTTRIEMPSLVARRSDIPFLIRELFARMAREDTTITERFFEAGEPRLDPLLVDALVRHSYQHQTRELERLLHVSVTTSRAPYLALTHKVMAALDDRVPERPSGVPGRPGPDLSPAEVMVAMRDAGGNVARAAAELGISRYILYRLLKKQGLDEPG